MTDSTKPTSSETAREKYMRLVAGPYASTWEWIGQELLVTFISGIKGALGLFLRCGLYPMVLKDIDRTAVVGASVTLRCPNQLRLGRNVIIDDYVQLIGNSSSRYSIDIDDDAFIRSYAMLNAGPPDGYIRLGKNSGIGQSTIIYGNGGVEIGNNVMVAGQCFIVASSHRFDEHDKPIKEQGHSAKGIQIGNNVWIGAGAKILDGVTIEDNAIVAANAVVNKDVMSGSIVGGIPAQTIGQVPARAEDI